MEQEVKRPGVAELEEAGATAVNAAAEITDIIAALLRLRDELNVHNVALAKATDALARAASSLRTAAEQIYQAVDDRKEDQA